KIQTFATTSYTPENQMQLATASSKLKVSAFYKPNLVSEAIDALERRRFTDRREFSSDLKTHARHSRRRAASAIYDASACDRRSSAAAENARILATRSLSPVSSVSARSTGPATARQQWPGASP